MYSAKEEAFLKDIQEAVRRIQAYTEDTDYDAFCADRLTTFLNKVPRAQPQRPAVPRPGSRHAPVDQSSHFFDMAPRRQPQRPAAPRLGSQHALVGQSSRE